MRVIIIVAIFSICGIFIANSLVSLQNQAFNLWAFVAMIVSAGLLLLFPRIAFGLIIAIVLFYDPRFSFPGISLWLHQWIILVAVLILIVRSIYQHRSFLFQPMDGILGILLLTFLISFVNSPDIFLGVKWTLYFLMLIFSYLLTRLGVTSWKQLKNIVLLLILGGVINGLISFFLQDASGRVGAIVLYKANSLGNFLALIFPMAVAAIFFGTFKYWKKVWFGLAILVITISLIMTYSRSSWLGVIVGLLALGFFKPRPVYFLILLICLGGVLLIPEVQQRAIGDREDSGIVYRQEKIEMAYRMFHEYPFFGQGPGSFKALAASSDVWGIREHSSLENLYLRMLAEGGLFQAVIFIILYIYITRLGLTTARAMEPGFRQAVVLGSLAGCWAVLGCGLGEDPFINPMLNWIMGLYLGIMVMIRQSVLSGSGKTDGPGRPSRPGEAGHGPIGWQGVEK
jgi:O-antigen ligase